MSVLNENEADRIYKAKRVQLTCPKCKYEFPSSDKTELDIKTKQLKKKRNKMQNLLRRYKKYGAFEDFMTEEWSKKVEEGILKCTEKISQIEALKKATESRVEEIKYFTLKELIRQRYGKEEFISLMDELEREVKAYHLQEMAQVKNFTHSEGGSLAKLNK